MLEDIIVNLIIYNNFIKLIFKLNDSITNKYRASKYSDMSNTWNFHLQHNPLQFEKQAEYFDKLYNSTRKVWQYDFD